MSKRSIKDDWYKSFFEGKALELWRRAKSEEETDEELAFLSELFDMDNEAHLLDAPCGNGRLSLPMAETGFKITALDYSEEFITEAVKAAKAAKVSTSKLNYVRGDMRTMSFKEKFDGAFCLGNSFGYFNRRGTTEVLKSISDSLKPGAKFVLDSIMVAETFLVNGAEREWLRLDDMLMLIENKYDCRESCVETDYTFIHDGQQETRKAVHWIYSVGELCSMLEMAGMHVHELLSSVDGVPYELGSERLILVSEKK